MIIELCTFDIIPNINTFKGLSPVWANTQNMATLRGRCDVPIRLVSNYSREIETSGSHYVNSDESHYQLLLTALATNPPILSLAYRYDVPPSWNKWLLSNYPEVLL